MYLLSLCNTFIIIITILGIIKAPLSFYLTGKTGDSFYTVWRSEAIQIGHDVSIHCQFHSLTHLIQSKWPHSVCWLGLWQRSRRKWTIWTPCTQVQWLSPTVQESIMTSCKIGLLKSFREALSILVTKEEKYRNLFRSKPNCIAD